MKKSLFFKIFFLSLFILCLSLRSSFAEIDANQLPTGANIKAGNITINEEPGKLTINQTSNQGIIEWNTFNVGSNAQVYFNHINSTDSILNQVLDLSHSTILGKIYSNGKLFLNNPNGISLGANATINAHSFIGSAMNLANHDFLNRNYHFTQDRAASIENLGDIKAQYVALMAPTVENKGVITSNNGATHLTAGDDMTLAINADQTINVSVNPSKIKATASNDGVIVSENGIVKIRADMAQDAIAATIKAPENQADGFVSVNGVIKLVANSGQIRAKQVEIAAGPNGGSEVSGSINTNSDTGKGGKIQVTGKEVTIKSTASLEAKGATGGGEILVGGSWQNTDPTVQQATYTTAEAGSVIDASATENGDGGTVVLWSDILNYKGLTQSFGQINSNGGQFSGDGGWIETSGAKLDITNNEINLVANYGDAGTWLLDPYNYIIDAGVASTLSSALIGGASIIVTTSNNTSGYGSDGISTGSGSIYVNSDIIGSGTGSLTLTADNFIYFDADITTTGTQTYNGDIFLKKNTTNLTSNNSNITFNDNIYTVTGAESLVVNAGSGNVNFNGVVGLAGENITTGVTGDTTNTEINGVGDIDSNGIFVYAANAGDSSNQTVNDINFLGFGSGTISNGGIKIYGYTQAYENWGGSATPSGNAALDDVLTSIRWTASSQDNGNSSEYIDNSDGTVELFADGLISGATYKLQVLLAEYSNSTRNFDIRLINNGTETLIDNFNQSLNEAHVVTHGFVAGSDKIYLKLIGTSGDRNPILSGFTLEVKPNTIKNLTVTAGQVSSTSNINFGSSSNFSINNSVSSNLSGSITGGLSELTKLGSATLTLSGINTYSGQTTISAGTLDISGRLGSGTYSGNISNSGTLTYSSSSDQILSGVISGTGALTKSGSSTLTLSGTNTYSGSTTISGGTLAVSNTSNLGATPVSVDADNIIFNGGALQITSSFDLDSNKGITLTGNGTVNTDSSKTLFYNGVITGSGNLTKSGSGSLMLNGSNTYTGSTTISAGNLILGSSSAIPTGSELTVNGLLNLNGFDLSVNSLSGSGSIVNYGGYDLYNYNNGSLLDGLILYLDPGNPLSYSGSGTSWSDLSSSSSHVTLTGSPTYTSASGTFDFESGKYAAVTSNGSSFSDLTDGYTIFSISNFGTADSWERIIDFGETNEVNNILFARSGTLNDLTLQTYDSVDGTAVSTTTATNGILNSTWASYAATIDGSNNSALYRDGSSLTSSSSGAKTPVNGTRSNLYIGKSNWADAQDTSMQLLLFYNRALSSSEISALHSATSSRTNATLTVNNSSSNTFSGTIKDNISTLGLTKSNSGALTLSGTNTYRGTTSISAGTLNITNANALGGYSSGQGTTVSDGAMLKISGGINVPEPITINGSGVSSDGAIYFLSGNNTYSGAITLGSNSTITSDAGNQTISGAIDGGYSLSINDDGGHWYHRGIIGGTTAPTTLTIDGGIIDLYDSVTTSGAINILASDYIYIEDDITITGASQNLYLKAVDEINQLGASTIQTNGGSVVFWANSDGDAEEWDLIRTGTINTNGGHVWLGGSLYNTNTRIWNGLTVGAGYAYSSSQDAVALRGNIDTRTTADTSIGGDVWIAGESGYATGADVGSEGAVRAIYVGNGDIALITHSYRHYNTSNYQTDLYTTGQISIAPISGADWHDTSFTFNYTMNGSWFEGDNNMEQIHINNFTSIGGLNLGTYNETGVDGDTAYVASNANNMTLSKAITINGPIRVTGHDIYAPNNIDFNTSSASNADIIFKGRGYVVMETNVDFTTNGGDVILWGNSVNTTSGTANNEVDLRGTNNVSTSGGKIVLAGGNDTNSDGIPDGYSYRSYDDSIRAADLGASVSLDSGGGDIIIRGQGGGVGVGFSGSGTSVDSGTGTITIAGLGVSNYGVWFGGSVAINSDSTDSTAINISGTSTNDYGIFADSGVSNLLIQSTSSTADTGDIIITGTGPDIGIGFDNFTSGYRTQILTVKGDITLNAEGTGNRLFWTNADAGFYLGQRANSTAINGITPVASVSTGNININSESGIVGYGAWVIKTGDASNVGGNVTIAADTDNSNGGFIYLIEGLTVNTFGGNFTMGGGDTSASGYAVGTTYNTSYSGNGIRLDSAITINTAGNSSDTGGDITIRGKGYASTWGAYDLNGFYKYGGSTDINSGTGKIYISGVAPTAQTNATSVGFYINGGSNHYFTSASPTSDAITIVGDSSSSSSNASEGFILTGASGQHEFVATGSGGGITITSKAGTSDDAAIQINDPTYILANGGDIILQVESGGTAARIYTDGGGLLNFGYTDAGNTNYDVTSSTSNIYFRSSGSIAYDALVTVRTGDISNTGGNLIIATDTNGSGSGTLNLRGGLDALTYGGNIILGGGDTSASGYAIGENDEGWNEGVRIDNVVNLQTSGGNIIIRGKTSTRSVSTSGYGNAGFGIYNINSNGTINSGSGTILITGINQNASSGTTYSSGVLVALNSSRTITITSSNTTNNAIQITGSSTGSNGNVVGMELETNSPLIIAATGSGGGASLSLDGVNYDLINRSGAYLYLLANGGDINFTGAAAGTNDWYKQADAYIGSKASSLVTSSSSDITLTFDFLNWVAGNNPYLATTGSVIWQSVSNSFSNSAPDSTWFNWNQNSQIMSGLTIGKSTNTSPVYLNADLTINGPLTVYAADIFANYNITTSAASGHIKLLASDDISIGSGKTFTTSGSGGNVIVSSDTDNTSGGAIKALGAWTISTDNGDIIIGGGNSSGTDFTNGEGNDQVGIEIVGAATFASQGGDIALRGEATAGTGDSAGIIFGSTVDIQSGTGTILIHGKNSNLSGDNASTSAGVSIATSGTILIKSLNTTSSAITITADASVSDGGRGLDIPYNVDIIAAGSGGGITINGYNSDSRTWAINLGSGSTILANGGDINLNAYPDDAGNYGWLHIPGLTIGSKASSDVTASSSNITLTADYFELDNNDPIINTSGNVTIKPYSNYWTSFGDRGDNFRISDFTFNNNSGGGEVIGDLTIGKSTNTNKIIIDESISVTGNVYLLAPADASTSDITIDSGDTITTTGTNKVIVIAAGDDFDNNSGSSALVANGSGSRWIVYSADDNISANFGSLNSNNEAVFGETYSSLAPASVASGNRYVFAETAAGVVISFVTQDETITYGDSLDLSDNYVINYTGGAASLSNVHLGSSGGGSGTVSLATAYSSNPTISISASGAGTSTSGNTEAGSYTLAISVSGGTLNSGYSKGSDSNAGTLTVNQKALSISGITASNKTYNGNTSATIDVSSASNTGLVSGDDVSVSATGTFSNKNVGTGKTVTLVSSYSGDDTGNYSITDQTSTTANITAKSISSLTLSASNKTYDGDTAATATVTSSDIESGDTVTFSNSAVFDTRHVGTGKTVTVSSISISGSDSSNYTLATNSGSTTANVTQLASVTWNGNAGDGLWSTAGNWVGSALPDQSNVAAVTIPSGASVTFDSDDVGTIGSSIANSGALTFSGSNNFTFAQVISGSGSLIKSNSNTLILSATNTYTGDTTVSSGTLNISGQLGSGTYAGDISNSGTLNYSSNSDQTLSGVISGTGTLTQSGSGTLTLSGTNTYSGATTISAGTLLITGKLGSGSYSAAISNSGILSYSSSSNQGLSGIISGTGSVVKSGTGTLTLSAMNTYSGGSTVNAGTLFGGAGSRSNTTFGSGAITVASGARLWIDRTEDGVMTNTLNLNGGTLRGTNGFGEYWDGNIVLGANSIIDNYYNFIIDGVISGSYGFTKTQNGNLKLRATNTYTGNTTISSGTITVSGLLGNGSYAGNISNSGTLAFNLSSDQTLSGVISGSGDLTKSGSSTLLLSGTNTYTGDTTVSAGTLAVSVNDALGTVDGGTTVESGANLNFQNVTYSTAEAITLNGGTIKTSTGTSSFAGNITLGANSTFNVDGTQLTLSGVVSDGGNGYDIEKTGSGILVLSGTNTYTGITTISAGTVSISADAGLGAAPSSAVAAQLTLNGGTLAATETFALNANRGVTLGSSHGTINVANTKTLTVAGIIAGSYNFTASGAGTLILTSASAYSGTTTVSSGTTFKISGSGSLGTVSSSVYTYAGQITNAGTFIYASDATQVLSGKVTGVGSLQKTTETSTLTLSSSSSDYTGSTTISAGTIKITNANALGATPGSADADNIIFNGGILQTTTGITLGTNKGITLTGNGIINTDASTTLIYGGIITGSADLTKLGSGTLTLSGSSTFQGDVNINAGTLNLNSTGRLFNTGSWGSHGVVTVGSNATLQIYNFDASTGSLGYLTYHASNLVINGGTLEFTGTDGVMGEAASNGTANKRAFTVGENGATLLNNTANTWSIWKDTDTATYNPVYNGDITFDGSGDFSFNNVISGTTAVIKNGSGTLTFTQANTYTGTTAINAGTLAITNAAGLGNSSTGTTVADGAMLQVSGGLTISEPITINGSGVSSNGALYFSSGNNTYSGAITLASNSTITSDAGNQIISGTINGAYTLDVTAAGNWTQSGIVGGTSPLTQYEVNAGSNDVSLSAAITLAGPLNIYSDDITIGSVIDTSAGGSSGDILFKVRSNIDHNSGANITTNGGDIIYWADSDNNSAGVISIRGTLTIETSGGHFWMGGGAASGTAWNSLTVGDGRAVSTSSTIEDHGILIYNTTINTGSGDIYIAGETQDNSSVTYGSYLEAVDIDTTSGDITIIGKATGNGSTKVGKTAAVQISASSSRNTTINTTSGNISITGTNASSIRADYASGIWIGGAFHGNGSSFTGDVSIETGAGSISLTADVSDTNVSTGWRHGIVLITRYANENVTIKTNSGNITFDATANYQSNTSDQSSFQIQTAGSSSDVKVVSQTGDITIIAEMLSTQEDDGQYENGIRISAANDTDNIMIGYDGTNAYSGDITFRSNSILQRTINAGSGSISVRTSGNLTFEPKDGSFTYLRADSASSLTFDDDWNFGTTLSSLTIGKSTNTLDVTFSNSISSAGGITVFGGDITINASQTLTAGANSNIVLSAANNFINNSGASALNVSGTGRWIVYAADNDNSTFGSLNSANTPIWSSTYSSLAPASVSSGNRYVFAESATQSVTFTTTDETITYGDSLDLTDNYSLTTSGVAGLANVYSATNSGASIALGTVYSSNPTISISATGASNSTSGNTEAGSYALAISLSGGSVNSGYTVSTSGTGTLTVNQKGLTISGITASNKTYNGNTTATVSVDSVTYTGLVAGDDVSVSATGTFSDKNVGTGKTVTLSSSYSGDDKDNYTFADQGSTTANITAKALSLSGLTASNKTYDGDTVATISSYGSLSGIETGDTVTLNTDNADPDFDTKNIGSGKTVTVQSLALSGDDAGNYSIANQTTTANITAKALTLSGLTADNKTYNGNTVATISSYGSLSGVISGDTVSLDSSSADPDFNNKNVGTGKTVTVQSLALSGDDAGNYTIGNETTNANITVKTLTATLSASNKTYDGDATVTSTLTLAGLVGSETLNKTYSATFSDKNVGTGKTVTVSSITLSDGDNGGLASNYTITSGQTDTANITAKALTLSGITASNKTYNGNTSATIDVSSASYTGLVDGDDLSISATGIFDNKNVGTGKTVTLTSTYAGDDVGNYSITDQASTTANITAKTLTASASASNKTYNGNTTASVTLTFTGLVGSETLGQTVGATFTDKNVGTGKTVTVNSISLADGDNGGLASNYTITTGQTDTADITAKVLTLSGITASNKTYNGNNSATVDVSSAVYTGLVDGDDLTVSATGAFSDKNVGTGKTVTLSSSYVGDDVGNYSITDQASTTANITAKALTLSGITASNKTYNGNTTATVDVSGAVYTGIVDGDDLTVSATGTFANKNIGTNKTVTLVSSYSGDDTGNYSITDQGSTTANITAKTLTVSGITAANKTYNGNTSATVDVSSAVYTGLVDGDDLTVSATGTFNNKNVGTGKTVTLSSSYSGDDTGNYSITDQTSTTADITVKTLTASASASNKTYDGDNTSTVTLTLTGVVDGDTVTSSNSSTFSDKNVGSGKTVTVNTVTLAGDDSDNYTIATGQTTTANITAKALSLSGLTADNKEYDGGTVATISSYGSLSGVITGDTVTLNTDNADPDFNNKNVGSGKTVTVQSLALSGDDAGNYSIANQTTTADVTVKTLTATASASDKVYNGNTTASVTLTLSGVIDGETVTSTNSSTFDNKNVGTEKTVTVNSITLAGADNGNYQISAGQTTTAAITKKTLTASLTGTVSKTYNGNTTATLTSSNYSISGFVAGEGASVTQTSGNYDSKNFGTSKTVTVSLASSDYTASDGTSLDNYTLDTGAVSGNVGTITKKNVTLTAPTITKTYDGTVAHTVTAANLSDLSAQLQDGDVVTTATISYANKNVGTGKTVRLSAATIDDGNSGNNYSITLSNASSGVITKAPLTITAIDDAKFVTQSDPTFTYVYNGFVNGETASALSTASEFTVGSVSRSNSSTNSAGSYSGVLVPGGFSADNYSITTSNGDFTIVPAEQLIFAITAGSNVTYGSSPVYSNSSGTHSFTAKYLASDNSTVVNLTGNVAVSGNSIVINDGAGTRAVFDIDAKDGTLSTSNNLKVGGYNLEATNSSITGSNFNSLFVTGSLTVDPIHIDVTDNTHISVTNVTKTYDGTATISSVPITLDSSNTIIETGDLVTVSGTGNYNNRHVGTSKAVTIDVALSGADSANYALIDGDGNANTRITGNVGTITQLSSVTWTGATTGGEWSNAANWDGGAIPDQSNVATAIIPTGYSVIYNSDVVGQISNTTIRNNGVIEFNGSSAFELDSVVTGIGTLKHSGDGILTISGNNTYSGNLNITNKEVSLTHNNALGTGNSITSSSGTLSIGSGVTLPSLTVTGAIKIKTNVTTTGAQIYNDDVTINSDNTLETIDYDNFTQTGEDGEITKTTLSSGDDGYVSKDWKVFSTSNANITFGGKLKASTGSKENKTSLIIKTCNTETCTGGEVTFDDKVGFEFIDKDMEATDAERENSGLYSNLTNYNKDNLYRLDVKAQMININANMMTWEEQIYRSPVQVGSNDASAVKYAVSVDPAVTFLSTVEDSGAAGTHTLVVRAIKLPSGSVNPKINFNINNIGNLAKFDPYALSLTNSSALSLNIGDFGSFGTFSGTVAGYSPVGGLRNNAYIITYSAPSVSSSSDRSTNIIKALTSAGNSGSILDFFKNLGRTSEGNSRVYSKSIEVFTGADARRGMPASSSSAPAQERKPETSKQGQGNSSSTNQTQDSNSSSEGEGGDDSQGSQCAEGQENSTECKNI